MLFIKNLIAFNSRCSWYKSFGAHRKKLQRDASTYEGEGKTSAKILNREMDYLMVNAYSSIGFSLNNGVRLLGPSIIFPRTVLSWNIAGIDDVHEKSLTLFSLIYPKLDMIVLGVGDQQNITNDLRSRLSQFTSKYNISFEILSTDTAVATFNYLNHEKRYCVGAFIPPSKVDAYNDRDFAAIISRQRILDEDDEEQGTRKT